MGEAATAARCTSRSTTPRPGCVDVLTQGAHLSAALEWLGSDAIFFQSNNDLERATLSTRAITTLDGPGAALWFDAISPDGSTLVYTTFQPDASVRTVPTSGGTPFEVTSYPAGTAQPQGAIWRADGQHLAYVNDYVGGEVDWVPATGGQPTVVMAAGNYSRRLLTYGSNGTMLVEESDRGGQNGVLVRVSESGAQTVLATDAYHARASPDGSTIAYATSAGDLYVIPASGGAPLPLGVNIPLVFATAFSPDGSLLAISGYDQNGRTSWLPSRTPTARERSSFASPRSASAGRPTAAGWPSAAAIRRAPSASTS